MDDASRNQIRNLIGVLGFAVLCAVFISAFLLYNYGPSGRYVVKNALLEPQLVASLSYNDTNSKTGGSSRFVFDGIEFAFYEEKSRTLQNAKLSVEKYQKIYELIVNDSSLSNVSSPILSQFNNPLASLSINVRTESHAAWQDEFKIFQKIDFSNDRNYFRIKLHEEQTPNEWVYFQHPDIYQHVLDIVIPKS